MWFFLSGASLKAAKSSAFCRSIYVKKVMKLVAFIFEHPSYLKTCSELLSRSIAIYIL